MQKLEFLLRHKFQSNTSMNMYGNKSLCSYLLNELASTSQLGFFVKNGHQEKKK